MHAKHLWGSVPIEPFWQKKAETIDIPLYFPVPIRVRANWDRKLGQEIEPGLVQKY